MPVSVIGILRSYFNIECSIYDMIQLVSVIGILRSYFNLIPVIRKKWLEFQWSESYVATST